MGKELRAVSHQAEVASSTSLQQVPNSSPEGCDNVPQGTKPCQSQLAGLCLPCQKGWDGHSP